MKKTMLAIVVTGLFAATAQAANVYDNGGVMVDLYGRLQFAIRDSGVSGEDLDGVGSARFGFKVNSLINEDLKALGRGEWQINAENSTDDAKQLTARHVYVGLASTDFGKVVFGQTDTAFYQAVAATDIFNSFGYAAFNLIETGRQEGQIVYNGEFGGFYVGASYQFQDDNFSVNLGNPDAGAPPVTIESANLDQSYALTLGYNFDFGLGVYGGYHAQEFVDDGDKLNYALSASYARDNYYLAGAYVYSDFEDRELAGYDLVAAYDIKALSIYAGYAYQEAQGIISEQGDLADEFTLGVQYKLNTKLKSWIEYKADQIADADDQWQLALQYNF